jgi:hypothetical protein
MIMTKKEKFIYVFVLILLFLVGIVAPMIWHKTELERDGFTVIEKHKSYTIVSKGGHEYIATEVGMYGLSWNYEHYPNCPCKKED